MLCLFQRDFHVSVNGVPGGKLRAETRYRDTRGEVIAKLLVDRKTFSIESACLETHRDMWREEIVEVKELAGIEAYLGAGPQLKKAFRSLSEPLAAPLFAETVRGIIQAETFLFKERGYTDAAAYSRYWEEMYSGTCRYYSNLDRVSRHWDEYVPESTRSGYLFLRSKTCFLYATGPEEYLVAGGISDTFHEMNACLYFRGNGLAQAEANLLRVPDDVCKEAASFFGGLVVPDVQNLTKKEISAYLGGEQGCVHLTDLVDDAVTTLKYYRQHPWDQGEHT